MSAANDPVPGRQVDWSFFDDAFPPTTVHLPEDPDDKRKVLSAMFHADFADIHRLAVVCFYAGWSCSKSDEFPENEDGSIDTFAIANEVNSLFGLFLHHINKRLSDSEGGENV